jgi:hypothetical protein
MVKYIETKDKDSERERGIGLALADKITLELARENVDVSFVGWTWLVEWYGKLGYKVWEEYDMFQQTKFS